MSVESVKFIPKDKDTELCIPSPKPAKSYIPKWYKDLPTELSTIDNLGMDGSAKKCIPFLDSFTSGYIQELPCDVSIENHGIDKETGIEKLSYNWAGPYKPMSTRMEDTKSQNALPHFPGFYNAEFHWNSFWEPQTPKGYSTLYFHPANRFDLPFLTLNAIIDTDRWSITGPVPFLLKSGFSGIIPAGTPMYQMIFIKRDEWHSSKEQFNEKFEKYNRFQIKKFLKGEGYKKLYWSKKEYF